MISHKMHRHPLRAATAFGLAGALTFSLGGCKSKDQAQNGQDPANANMAQPYTGGDANGYSGDTGQAQVAGQSQSYTPQSSSESYQTQAAAPIIHRRASQNESQQYYQVPQSGGSQASYNSQQAYNQGYQQGYGQGSDQGYQQGYNGNYNQGYSDQSAYNQGYSDAEYAGEEALAEAEQPPPPLPQYDQPPAPEDDYLWTPGYWNYASAGYYWVPGAWVAPPFVGALWTPAYWGYDRGHYICHRGYWGPHVGYYGGVNYGFGYVGTGYFGGYWHDRDFYYNRAVTNVNITNVHNVYNHTVIVNNITYGPRTTNYISYNGGRGGLTAQPQPQELAAMHEAHFAPVAAQQQNRLAAQNNRAQFFSANGGRPAQAFDGRAIGNVRTIAAAPTQQPFNHPAVFARPNANNTPNLLARTSQPNQPISAGNRPGTPNQPGIPGGNRLGTPSQPAFTSNNRPNTANQPGRNANNRPAEFNRTNNPASTERPAVAARPNNVPQPSAARPAEINRPGTPGSVNRPEQTRPGSVPQPAFNRSGEVNRPVEANRSVQPTQPRPNFEQPRQAQPQPQPRPSFDQPRQTQPQSQARPNFEQPRQAQPQPRPNFEQPRQAQPQERPSAPAGRPQVEAQRPATPAPHAEAPHPAAGNEHRN